MDNWEKSSTWVASIVGSTMAIVLVTLFQPKRRIKAAKAMLSVGAVCAVPFALVIRSLVALLATVLSGLVGLWFVKRLTSSRKDAPARAAWLGYVEKIAATS